MKTICTADELLEMIREDAAHTSQSAVARAIGVSVVYVGEILRGTRPVSDRVASYYGFRKEVVYRKAS